MTAVTQPTSAALAADTPTITSVSQIIAQNGTVTCATGVCVTGSVLVITGTGFGNAAPVATEVANVGGPPVGSSAVGVQAKTKNLEVADTTTKSFMGLAGASHGFIGFADCLVTIGSWSDTRIIVLLDDTGLVRSLNRCSDIAVGDKFSVQVWNTDTVGPPSRVFSVDAPAIAIGKTASLSHVAPASGPIAGGTFAPGGAPDPAGKITVTGTDLSGASIVWFGNGGAPGAAVAVTDFTLSADNSSLTVVPPPSPLGVDRGNFIAITTPAGTSDVQCNTIIQGCEGTYYYQSPSNVIPTINGSTGPLDLSADFSKEIPLPAPGACPKIAPAAMTNGITIAAGAKVTGGPVTFSGVPQTSTNLGILSSVQVPITVTIEQPVEITLTLTGKISGCFAVPIPGLNIAGLGGVYVLIGGSLEVGYKLTATLNKGTFVINVGYVANQLAGVSIPTEGQKCVDPAGVAAPCLQTHSSGFLTGTLFFSPLWIQLNIGVGPAKIQAGAGLTVAGFVNVSTDTGFDYDVCFGGNYAVSVKLGPAMFDHAGLLFGPFNIYGNGLRCPLGPIGTGLATPTVALTSSANPVAPNQPVTYTATVTPTATAGTVSFADNRVLITACQTVPVDATGKATCPQTYTDAGLHTIVATYGGDTTTLSGAASTPLAQVVGTPVVLTPTSVALVSSANPSLPNVAVTYTATVSPTDNAGTVSFTDNVTPITTCQTVALDATGKATCAQTYTAVGTHSIVATYSGNTKFATSTSTALAQVVSVTPPTATAVALVSSANPAKPNDAVTYSATVSPTDKAGTVSFTDNGTAIATCQTVPLDATGKATCAQTYATVGTHSIVATYSGNTKFATSTSAALAQRIAIPITPPPGPQVTSTFTPAVPERLLDTRPDGPQVGYSGAKPTAGQTIVLQVTGAGSTKVPAGAGAVVLNVTGTEADDDGYVTVWPCDTAKPLASNLNLSFDITSPNLVSVKLSATGTVCLYTQIATHLLADIAGYFPAGSSFTPVVPERLLDTRPGGPQVGYTGAKPVAGQTIVLQVAGAGATKVPAGTGAVWLNVTGTEANDDGYVTVWPCDTAKPLASNLNLSFDITTPNLVSVKLSAIGTVCLYTQVGTHLLADIAGYFPTGSGFTPVVPERLLDTRPDGPQVGYTGAKPVAGQTITLQVTGAGTTKVPAGTSAVVINVTGTEAVDDGYVTVWPCDAKQPVASNLNLFAGATAPNLAVVKLSAAGTVCLFIQPGTHLLADIAGYFPA